MKRVWGLALVLLGCARPDTRPLGTVQDCDNGTYFSLKSQSCQTLWGHEASADSLGFERIHIFNGVTVPRKINGQTPFVVDVAYDVSRASTLELVMKHVEFAQVGDDGLTDWQKLEIPVGRGQRSFVLKPNAKIPKGPAAAYMDGRWAINSGYIIEIKGGDRFEDEDADGYASWRVAGIQVDPAAPDDPMSWSMILGDLEAPDTVHGCETIRISLPIRRLNFDADFDLALKQPGSGWAKYGGQILSVPRGFLGKLLFEFETRSEAGTCAPASGLDPATAYVFQLDIYANGSKLDTSSRDYKVPQSSKPVAVTNKL